MGLRSPFNMLNMTFLYSAPTVPTVVPIPPLLGKQTCLGLASWRSGHSLFCPSLRSQPSQNHHGVIHGPDMASYSLFEMD